MLQASRTHSATHNRVRLAQEEGTPEQRYGTESELTSHEDPDRGLACTKALGQEGAYSRTSPIQQP